MIDEEEEIYQGEPVYDEDPTEINDELEGQEVILVALGMDEVKKYQPLQLEGFFHNRGVKILLDSGSSLNLINNSLCSELGLHKAVQATISFKLPNGDVLTSMC